MGKMGKRKAESSLGAGSELEGNRIEVYLAEAPTIPQPWSITVGSPEGGGPKEVSASPVTTTTVHQRSAFSF